MNRSVRRLACVCIAISIYACAVWPSPANLVEIVAGKDNTLYESGTGHLSNGQGNYIFAGRVSSGGGGALRRAVLWFDIQSLIPAGSTVTSAVLRLNASTPGSTGTQNMSLHRALADWGEGASQATFEEGTGAASEPGDATWIHTFHNTNLWTVAGGDFDAIALATTAVTGNGFYEWQASALLDHVQDAVDGVTPNHGFVMLGNESVLFTAKRFDSRHHPTAGNRPVLVVGFDEPPPPEPEPRITHTARILPEFEVPPQTNDFAGAGGFAYDRSTRTLRAFIIHDVTNMTAAHIHGPAGVGTNAGVVFTLPNELNMEDEFVLNAQQEQELLDGLYYVNIHNAAFPDGAIRGQIVVDDHFGAALLGEDEVPPATNDFFGIALFSYDRPTRTLDYFIVHDVTNVTAAHIHGFAPEGEGAGIVVDLGGGESPIRGATVLDASLEAALRIEHLYVNVHNGEFPNGAIRGQIEALDAFDTVTHSATLESGKEVPPMTNDFFGVALVSYSPASGFLEYFISHDVTNATAAHFHGPADENGTAPITVDLGIPTSPIVGEVFLSPTDAANVLGGLWYINIHNAEFPDGAIRGQVMPEHAFTAHLDGRNETPPRTVDEAGAAVFQYDHETREFSYFIDHSVREPTVAHIHGPAAEGVPGPILHDLGSATSPIVGSIFFSPADEFNLLAGRLFVNVHSTPYPAGALRGQILAAEPTVDATMTAALTPDQETPPLTNNFSGTAVLEYDRSSRLLRWFVEHNVEDMTGVHIHGPAAPGTPAGIVFNMGDNANPIQGNRVLTPAQEQDLLNGLYYINVHNPEYPGGAIRGQILSGDRFHTTLQGRQETPPVPTSATGAGIFAYDFPTRTLSWRVEHSVEDVTAAHIHGPAAPGVPAGIVVGLGASSPITGSAMLTAQQERELLDGRYYVNVHSPTFPGGEVRGQIRLMDPVPDYTHTAILTGDQEAPPVTNNFSGVGLFAYDCVDRILHLEIHHSVTDAVAAHIHGPAGVGTNAGIVVGFDAPHSPIIESFTLTPAQDDEFRSGLWYVNIHNPAFPDGAIRGQIEPAARLTSLLEGREQENPGPLTTAARGVGVYLFNPATTQLVYHIEHTVTNPSVAHIHGPAPQGAGAPPVFNTPHMSPITGATNLTAQQVVELFQGLYYINVHSGEHAPGEIRGQILPAFPDSACSGIDDFWQLDHGLTPGTYDPTQDLDGDGFTVEDEYIADTDPNSSNSFPHVKGIASVGATNEISFATSPFRLYMTDRTTNLIQGVWDPMQIEPIQGTGAIISVPATNDVPHESYRLRIKRP